jgi:myosin heavy subunit
VRVLTAQTQCGEVLIALNPWRQLDLYADAAVDNFIRTDPKRSVPHVFRVAKLAYDALLSSGCNQSILVSGDSGSGKTETTKFVMRFLSAHAVARGHQLRATDERVLKSNPLLEAFGNAKTLRNDNSSRFVSAPPPSLTAAGQVRRHSFLRQRRHPRGLH